MRFVWPIYDTENNNFGPASSGNVWRWAEQRVIIRTFNSVSGGGTFDLDEETCQSNSLLRNVLSHSRQIQIIEMRRSQNLQAKPTLSSMQKITV